MRKTAKLKRILVVLNPAADAAIDRGVDGLILRSIALAKANDSHVELFHPCHDIALEQTLFAANSKVEKQRHRLCNRAATQLEEIALRYKEAGVSVNCEVLWDHPLGDAILRRADETGADLIIKLNDAPRYLLGILDNTDWGLIRRATSHVWFVNTETTSIQTIVTAIGTVAKNENIIAAADYDVFRVAQSLAREFGARNLPVHAYQAPQGNHAYSIYLPMTGPITATQAENISKVAEGWQLAAQEHGKRIRAFAQYFNLDEDSIKLQPGSPADVLPRIAESVNADLIVMGARSLSRWERALLGVTAEPVLAEAPCDILFVKEPDGPAITSARKSAIEGEAIVDIEEAILKPDEVFGSPEEVTATSALSIPMRVRILQAWRHDVEALLNECDEGGPQGSCDPEMIRIIDAQLERLWQSGSNPAAGLRQRRTA